MQEFLEGVILGSMPVKKGRKQDWEGKKLNCRVVKIKASANPTGSSGVRLAGRLVLHLNKQIASTQGGPAIGCDPRKGTGPWARQLLLS